MVLRLELRTDIDKIIERIRELQVRCLHVTNGTYMAPQEVLEGTTLSGFQYIDDHVAGKENPLSEAFLVAVNSDKSLDDAGKHDHEEQITRAMKVAMPMAKQFSDRREVIACFYDEETPNKLYEALAANEDITLGSLHKWGGFGIGKDAPVIEGAELFNRTLAFPFYNADKPVFWNETRRGDQSDIVEVVDLHRTDKNNGGPYLDAQNKPLFALK